MAVAYEVVIPPATELLTLAEAKSWLRVDYTDEDDLISDLITDAREYGERLCNRSFAPQSIHAIIAPDPAPAGPLSGPVDVPIDVQRLWERPGIPLFGNARLELQLPMSPVASISTMEYQITKMDEPEWTTLVAQDTGGHDNYRIDTIALPSVLSIFTILAASRYRITYTTAGYTTLPKSLKRAMSSLVAWWYLNREGQDIPAGINAMFAGERVIEL